MKNHTDTQTAMKVGIKKRARKANKPSNDVRSRSPTAPPPFVCVWVFARQWNIIINAKEGKNIWAVELASFMWLSTHGLHMTEVNSAFIYLWIETHKLITNAMPTWATCWFVRQCGDVSVHIYEISSHGSSMVGVSNVIDRSRGKCVESHKKQHLKRRN